MGHDGKHWSRFDSDRCTAIRRIPYLGLWGVLVDSLKISVLIQMKILLFSGVICSVFFLVMVCPSILVNLHVM